MIKDETMTSRERVHATVKGQPVDRVPVFLWINAHTGCKLMTRYKPSKNLHWNLIAKLLWSRFERSGADAGEFWRLLPLIYDVHTFNRADSNSLELGADMVGPAVADGLV